MRRFLIPSIVCVLLTSSVALAQSDRGIISGWRAWSLLSWRMRPTTVIPSHDAEPAPPDWVAAAAEVRARDEAMARLQPKPAPKPPEPEEPVPIPRRLAPWPPSPRTPAVVLVATPPPAAPVEDRGPQRGASYVWVPGRFEWFVGRRWEQELHRFVDEPGRWSGSPAAGKSRPVANGLGNRRATRGRRSALCTRPVTGDNASASSALSALSARP